MSAAPMTMSETEALRFLAAQPAVHLAGLDASGGPLLRPLHTALWDGRLVFHGRPGEKAAAIGGAVVVAAHEVVVGLPSYFFHPERACPATTWFLAAEAHGLLEAIEAPAEKAGAMAAIMAQHQPEGGYTPLSAEDPQYRAALERLAMFGVRATRVSGRVKLGQHLPAERVASVLASLWARGAPGDLEAMERIARAHAARPWPATLCLSDGARARPACADDLPAVVDLLRGQYWLLDASDDDIAAAHRGASAWMVVSDAEGRVLASGRAVSDRARRAWIYDVVVAPQRRGGGLGRAIVEALLAHPALRDVPAVWLGTRDAMAFYAGLGFTTVGSLPVGGAVGPEAPASTQMVRRRAAPGRVPMSAS